MDLIVFNEIYFLNPQIFNLSLELQFLLHRSLKISTFTLKLLHISIWIMLVVLSMLSLLLVNLVNLFYDYSFMLWIAIPIMCKIRLIPSLLVVALVHSWIFWLFGCLISNILIQVALRDSFRMCSSLMRGKLEQW